MQLLIFILILIIIIMIIFVIIAFNFYFSSFYYSILPLYISNIFKFWTNDVAEHCSKLEKKTLRLPLTLTLLGNFEQCLPIFFRSGAIVFCPWQLFLLFCRYFLILIYYAAELSVFSFLISLQIYKASEKKRNIWCFNKLCVFLIHIYIYI